MKRKLRIGFQGELGAFSQEAIENLFTGTAEPVPCAGFVDVFQALAAGAIDAAVIPIENTLHGSVHENYDHILKYDVKIVGETNLRIIHNLIAPPDLKWKDIRKVFSHPVALNQCLGYFEKHPRLEKTPFYDTAGSVRMIMEQKPPGAAAIASSVAAEMYGARILKRSIEDDRRNYTRFFLLNLGRKVVPAAPRPDVWKTSIVFTTRNVPGALFRGLSAFALRDLNLLKIESRPLRGKPWEYLFYLDFGGRESDPIVRNALGHIAELADFLRVLGSYPKGA